MPLTITTNGQKLAFLPAGDVAVMDGAGNQSIQGVWRTAVTAPESEDNKVRYTLCGAEQTPIQARYRITASNQLQVTLCETAVKGSELKDSAVKDSELKESERKVSEPFVFSGSLEIDDAHHIIYNLVDCAGADLHKAITIYGGNFRIEENTSNLLVDLPTGETLSISGDSGVASLEAVENHIAGFDADDLLHFHASTDNTLEDGSVVTIPARLTFIGSWDIQSGKLVFLSKITGNIAKPDVHIGFAGQIGAITAGFVYFADSAGTQASFNISGRHVWKAGNTTDKFNWQSSLGFTGKTFQAQTDFDFNSLSTCKRNFSVQGNLTLKQDDGGTKTLGFHLTGQYAWDNNIITFRAGVTDAGGGLDYDLMLEGTFKLDRGSISFSVKFSNDATVSNSFGLGLNYQGDQAELIKALSFQLQIAQTQAGAMINATAEIQLRYVKGVGVLRQVA